MRRINTILVSNKKTFQILKVAGTIAALMAMLVAGAAAQPIITPN